MKILLAALFTTVGISATAQSVSDLYLKTRQEHYTRIKKRDLDKSLKGLNDYTAYSADFEHTLLMKAFALYKAQQNVNLEETEDLKILKNRTGEFPKFLMAWNKRDTIFILLNSLQRQNKGGIEEIALARFGSGFSKSKLADLNRVLHLISDTVQFETLLDKFHNFKTIEPWFEYHVYNRTEEGLATIKNYAFGLIK